MQRDPPVNESSVTIEFQETSHHDDGAPPKLAVISVSPTQESETSFHNAHRTAPEAYGGTSRPHNAVSTASTTDGDVSPHDLGPSTVKGILVYSLCLAVVSFQALIFRPEIALYTRISDVLDLMVPIYCLPVMWHLFHRCGISATQPVTTFAWTWFLIAIGVFMDGHGIHLAANLVKRPIKDFKAQEEAVYLAHPLLQDSFDIADLWDNTLGHYVLGAGLAIFTVGLTFMNRNHLLSEDLSNKDFGFLVLACVAHGAVHAGAAVNFPSLSLPYFVLCLCFVVGFCIWDYQSGPGFRPRQRPVVLWTLASFIVVVLILTVWAIANDGFVNRKDV